MTPEIQKYIDDAIRMHIHDGNFAQRVNLYDLFGYIDTITQLPSVGVPSNIYGQFKIYNRDLWYYDFLNKQWNFVVSGVAADFTSATIATTGNTDTYYIVPASGSVTAIYFSALDALTADDTNYITWTVTNLGQAGAGSTAILAATNANTTKATGGTGIAANTKRTLTLNGTAANLVVVAGDRLRIRAAATGTLANTVSFPVYFIKIQ